jgi:hypothetical protein
MKQKTGLDRVAELFNLMIQRVFRGRTADDGYL